MTNVGFYQNGYIEMFSIDRNTKYFQNGSEDRIVSPGSFEVGVLTYIWYTGQRMGHFFGKKSLNMGEYGLCWKTPNHNQVVFCKNHQKIEKTSKSPGFGSLFGKTHIDGSYFCQNDP